jgi:hypothetical protein
MFLKAPPSLKQTLALRKQLQKVEFLACWMIVFVAAAADHMMIRAPASSIPSCCYYYMILYCKFSTFTRALAYTVDLTNAWVKFDGAIPSWLALHHSGILAGHITEIFFLTPKTLSQLMVIALGFQSSHNTWTKKYSLKLYWANVLLGVLSWSKVYSDRGAASEEDMDSTSSTARLCSYYSIIVSITGILLLALDSTLRKWKYQFTVKRMPNKRKDWHEEQEEEENKKKSRGGGCCRRPPVTSSNQRAGGVSSSHLFFVLAFASCSCPICFVSSLS